MPLRVTLAVGCSAHLGSSESTGRGTCLERSLGAPDPDQLRASLIELDAPGLERSFCGVDGGTPCSNYLQVCNARMDVRVVRSIASAIRSMPLLLDAHVLGVVTKGLVLLHRAS